MYFLKPRECRKKSAIWVRIISALVQRACQRVLRAYQRVLRASQRVLRAYQKGLKACQEPRGYV